jgi:hypothetical protein
MLLIQAANDKQAQMLSSLESQVRQLEKEREARVLAEEQCAARTEQVLQLEAQLKSATAFMKSPSEVASGHHIPRSAEDRTFLSKVGSHV